MSPAFLANEKIGRKTTIKGCVDLLYVAKHGTPELVEETAREAMEVAKFGGGFIIGNGSKLGSRPPAPHGNELSYNEAIENGAIFPRGAFRNALKRFGLKIMLNSIK